MEDLSDYMKYRGKCKEMAEQAVNDDPTLRLVRGTYYCPIWGAQQHWWAEKPDGTVVDPSVKQFPTAGLGAHYIEFEGWMDCEYCHQRVHEDNAYMVEHHVYCSGECYGPDVGF